MHCRHGYPPCWLLLCGMPQCTMWLGKTSEHTAQDFRIYKYYIIAIYIRVPCYSNFNFTCTAQQAIRQHLLPQISKLGSCIRNLPRCRLKGERVPSSLQQPNKVCCIFLQSVEQLNKIFFWQSEKLRISSLFFSMSLS